MSNSSNPRWRRGGKGHKNPNAPQMAADRSNGMTYKSIGNKYGISRVRAMVLCKRHLQP